MILEMKHKQPSEVTKADKLIYLNDAIDVKTHHKLRDVAHQIVKPVVDSCQDVDWFVVVSGKNKKHTHFNV